MFSVTLPPSSAELNGIFLPAVPRPGPRFARVVRGDEKRRLREREGARRGKKGGTVT